MGEYLKKAGLATVLAATTLTAAAPADAQRYWRHRDRGGDVATGAIIGGVIGLGLGAAIASSNRDRYYDRGYYYNDGYYRVPPRRFYRDRYYAPPRGYWRDRGYYRGGYNGYYGQPYRGYYGW